MNNLWQEYYKSVDPSNIPWNRVGKNWIDELIEEKVIKGKRAIDLGCGYGTNTIKLAKFFDEVLGVDISEDAIEGANEKSNLKNVKFKVLDLTNHKEDLGRFDFVLDWSTIHTIPKSNRRKYIQTILDMTMEGSLLLIRCFLSQPGKAKEFEYSLNGVPATLSLFSKNDIQDLFGKSFDIIRTGNKIKSKGPTHLLYLQEYLLKRKVT